MIVRKRISGKAKMGEPASYVVEAVGYGVQRTVGIEELRPRAPE